MEFVLSKGDLREAVELIRPAATNNLVHVIAEHESDYITLITQNEHAMLVKVVDAEVFGHVAMSLDIGQVLRAGNRYPDYHDISFMYEEGDIEVTTRIGDIESGVRYACEIPESMPLCYEDVFRLVSDRDVAMAPEAAAIFKMIKDEFYNPLVAHSKNYIKIFDMDTEAYFSRHTTH